MTNLHDIATVTATSPPAQPHRTGRAFRTNKPDRPHFIKGLDRDTEFYRGKAPTRCEHPRQRETRCSDINLECGRTRPRRPIARELAPLHGNRKPSGGSAR